MSGIGTSQRIRLQVSLNPCGHSKQVWHTPVLVLTLMARPCHVRNLVLCCATSSSRCKRNCLARLVSGCANKLECLERSINK